MNVMTNPIIFYVAAFLMIVSAIFSLRAKNIFNSLLLSIIVFFVAGLIFYMLRSEYNAVIQLAIYGVAVPVILGLAIMFTNQKKEDKSEINITKINYVTFLFAGIFILALIYLVMTSLLINPVDFNTSDIEVNSSLQVLGAIAHGIFVKYVWAFELVSLILTIIVVGLTIFVKKEDGR